MQHKRNTNTTLIQHISKTNATRKNATYTRNKYNANTPRIQRQHYSHAVLTSSKIQYNNNGNTIQIQYKYKANAKYTQSDYDIHTKRTRYRYNTNAIQKQYTYNNTTKHTIQMIYKHNENALS